MSAIEYAARLAGRPSMGSPSDAELLDDVGDDPVAGGGAVARSVA